VKKDFLKWHTEKARIHEAKSGVFFHEREVWWCALGLNVGFEQDGSGEDFQLEALLDLQGFQKYIAIVAVVSSFIALIISIFK